MIHALFLALSLFDGESLAGWSVQGEASWGVDEGAIVAAGAGDGFLVSDADFDDFRLTLEFWVDATTNSGVFIRCTDRSRIHPDTCYELNIWDHHPRQEARTGAIVFQVMPPRAQVQTIGSWNSMKVLADGGRITLSVNGVVTAELDRADLRSGFIALQHWEQGTVRFRNIQLMPLED
jgi:hypothetical protein